MTTVTQAGRDADPGTDRDPSTACLRVNVLGEVTATLDDADLPLGGRRQRAVLALLVLARGEVVPSEVIADALWPGAPAADVSTTLHSSIGGAGRGAAHLSPLTHRG